MKICPKCSRALLLGAFHKNRSTPDGFNSWCKECLKEWRDGRKLVKKAYDANHYKLNETKARAYGKTYHRKRHGVSDDRFNAMLDRQGNRCAICRTDVPGGVGWHIDHDHLCCPRYYSCGKCVRGVLCGRCNRGLGFMKDSTTLLHSAINYLQKGTIEPMNNFEIGTVVVHKSMGSQPLVVVGFYGEADKYRILARYGTQGQNGVRFMETDFHPEELETPVESIEREGEIFKTLNRKKNEVNAEIQLSEPEGPSGIGHLN